MTVAHDDTFSLSDLPNELIVSIMTHLSSRELARLSTINRMWHESSKLIFKRRISKAFGETGVFRYVFEASQPVERVRGTMLQLREGKSSPGQGDLQIGDDFAQFQFPPPGSLTSQYSFSLDSDTFIQLCILGNIIQQRAGGGLEGVAQHMEDFCRIKDENINKDIGGLQTFKINGEAYLVTRILRREPYAETGGVLHDESPVRYDIEFHSLWLRSAQVLRALEIYLANTSTSTALVLRTVT